MSAFTSSPTDIYFDNLRRSLAFCSPLGVTGERIKTNVIFYQIAHQSSLFRLTSDRPWNFCSVCCIFVHVT